MPTYEYKCLDCGEAFEHFQRITEEPLTACLLCSGQVKRLIGTGSSPIFKGSGFYQTDYKNKNTAIESKQTSSKFDGENKSG
ncbi:MAG: FmdB family zinc ribbon protein [Bacteroidota bacterium]